MKYSQFIENLKEVINRFEIGTEWERTSTCEECGLDCKHGVIRKATFQDFIKWLSEQNPL